MTATIPNCPTCGNAPAGAHAHAIHGCPTCGDALAVSDPHLDHTCARCGHGWRSGAWTPEYLTAAELPGARAAAAAHGAPVRPCETTTATDSIACAEAT